MLQGESSQAGTEATARTVPDDTWNQAWPYVVPMVGFLALTSVESYLPTASGGVPSPVWYPLFYTFKLLVVMGLAWLCRSAWLDLVPRPGPVLAGVSVLIGAAVIVAWVGLDGRYPSISWLGQRVAFDPAVIPVVPRIGFLTVRFIGLVLVVPLIEELFYRSFLLRWIVDPDIRRVPIGTATLSGLAATTAVFALSHPEWLPAALTALAWGLLVRQTRSVSACVISHSAANLILGIYVLATGHWRFW
ncbi:MAG: CAAX prenyl protease-related protein [Isosphaeraceae bacterium]